MQLDETGKDSNLAEDNIVGALIGSVFDGKYRVERMIGAGAMGSVLAGTHVGLEKRVAIKVLHPWLASDPRSCQRFLQEAHAIGSLNHPNVVSVDGCGRTGDYIYIAMDYLEGESLAQRIKREGKIDIEDAIKIVTDAAHGLAHAHAAGILHRDVKPSNIMLCGDTTSGAIVKVVDFGIAKTSQSGDSVQSLTATNATLGTPYYMSPEQGIKTELDARTDIYSLGCVLYECVSGHVAFDGESPLAVMLAHLHEPPRPLPETVPEWLCSVIAKAMATDREQRYQTMQEFINALATRTVAPQVVASRKSRVLLPVSRKQLISIMAAAVLVCLMLVQVMNHRIPPGNSDEVLPDQRKSLDEINDLSRKIGYAKERHDEDTVISLESKVIEIGRTLPRSTAITILNRYWSYYGFLIGSHIERGNLDAAEELAQKQLEDVQANAGQTNPFYARALICQADVLYAMNDRRRAKELYEQGCSIALRYPGKEGVELSTAICAILQASVNYAYLNPQGAVALVEKLLAWQTDEYSNSDDNLAAIYSTLSTVQLNVGQIAESRDSFEHCISNLMRQAPAAERDVKLASYRFVYAEGLSKQHRLSEAYEQYRLGESFAAGMIGPRDYWHLVFVLGQCRILRDLNKFEEALSRLRDLETHNYGQLNVLVTRLKTKIIEKQQSKRFRNTAAMPR